jgi:type IV pilus assembly protein PilO
MKANEFDFNNLDFQRMGGWPTPVKAVFCTIIFAIIAAGGWWFYIKPKQETLKRAEAEEAELLQTFEYKQNKVVNLEPLKKQLETMKEILSQMVRQLPSKTEMPELLVDISQTALSTGIDNQKFEPGPETIKEFYAEKPINLRMVGSYHQFGSFVSGVAALPRVVILTMHDISLKPQTVDPKTGNPASGELVLEGTVKTYRYVEDDEAAASTATAAPGATAGGP